MNQLLEKILDSKSDEVTISQSLVSLEDIKAKASGMPPARRFAESIKNCGSKHKVIAEIKRISPGSGFKREEFDPVAIAKGYQSAGACAISVLTDENFFGGSLNILEKVRAAVRLPLLRKDFIIDRYQIFEARAYGADAVLLMAINFKSPVHLADMAELALETGLEVLVEIHGEDELAFIPKLPVCVGLNNRDFKSETLEVNLDVTRKVVPMIESFEGRLIVSESGIRSAGDMKELEVLGVDAFLIGSAFMEQADPGEALSGFLGG